MNKIKNILLMWAMFICGAIVIPPFVLILLLRMIGMAIHADRLCAWVWKCTTYSTR